MTTTEGGWKGKESEGDGEMDREMDGGKGGHFFFSS